MTTLNVVGLMVAGWVVGDIITLTTAFLNRRKIRAVVATYVSLKQAEAVNAYIAQSQYEEHIEEEFSDEDFENQYNN